MSLLTYNDLSPLPRLRLENALVIESGELRCVVDGQLFSEEINECGLIYLAR
jgi:hypothetical protein